jgi:uncharacterized phiE125 gp8 family phage protein
MTVKRTVEPTELPVTMDEVKGHMNVTHTEDDGKIAGYLAAVVDGLDGPEGLLGRALITQTLEYTLDSFPRRPIDLPLAPMQSVSSITYIDTNGDSQTLAAATYRVLNADNPMRRGRIELAYGSTWPSTRRIEQAVTVTYVAGFGARNAVPEHIRLLIMYGVKAHYDWNEPFSMNTRLFESPAWKGLFYQSALAGGV